MCIRDSQVELWETLLACIKLGVVVIHATAESTHSSPLDAMSPMKRS